MKKFMKKKIIKIISTYTYTKKPGLVFEEAKATSGQAGTALTETLSL